MNLSEIKLAKVGQVQHAKITMLSAHGNLIPNSENQNMLLRV